MKAIIATLCSLIIPGLGQLFYGKVLWAVVWFGLAWLTCGVANILSAIHCISVAAE